MLLRDYPSRVLTLQSTTGATHPLGVNFSVDFIQNMGGGGTHNGNCDFWKKVSPRYFHRHLPRSAFATFSRRRENQIGNPGGAEGGGGYFARYVACLPSIRGGT